MTIINFTPNKDSLKPLHSQEETDFYADFITKQNEDFVKRWAPERHSGDEFIDYDLEQEETQMSSRGLFGIKGPKRITNQKEIAQILKRSKSEYEHAQGIKNEAYFLINNARGSNFQPMFNIAGNLVDFEEDCLGRIVMIECDKNDKPIRKTTFTPQDGEIVFIEELMDKSINHISYFNHGKNIEIKKGIKNRLFKDTIHELFIYKGATPVEYCKKGESTALGTVWKQILTF